MTANEYLYTAAQTRALDACAIRAHGIPGITLMARAAEVTLRHLLAAWPEPAGLSVLCGTGNNGGDGFLVADLAHKRGIPVRVLQLGDAAKVSGDALLARQQALRNGVPFTPYDGQALDAASVVVDAMLGTGLGGPVREAYAAAIAAVNASDRPVVAVDIPSGLCADTGRVLGAAVRADMTVTFIGLKRGLFTLHGPDHAGALQFSDLGVPGQVYDAVPCGLRRLELEALLAALPPRPAAAHKGMFGSVLVVGGDRGMAGAALLAAEAALRCGAGLVRVATRAEHVAAIVARVPEVMPQGIDSVDAVAPLLAAADVLVLGPGLGQSPWSEQLARAALAAGLPLVIDADALNLLAAGRLGDLPAAAAHVLTPHPGEAARLLGATSAEVQADRFAAATELQRRFGGVVVLKGNGSLVATAGEMLLSDYGNPGMAVGGMGDVLSGVIGALLAQGLAPPAAAALGVCLHGAAGDRAAAAGQRGLAASDLMPQLRALLG